MAKKILISSSSVLLCLLLAAFLLSLLPGQSNPTDASALPDQPELYEDLTNYTSVDELVDALLANGAEYADLPQTLYNLADTQWHAGNYEQARQLYKYIADNMSDNDLAFNARAWVAGSDIKLANFDDAEEEIDALIKDFAGHPQLTTIIYKLADYYWYAGSYQNAKALYQFVFDRDPQGDLAIWAKAWVAGADIWLGHHTLAQQGIYALIKDFDDHPELTSLIYKLADHYWYAGKYQNARDLYQIVVDREPEGELALWAKAWLAGLQLILDNSTSAQQVVDTLIADCGGHPNLAQMIYGIANGCWYVQKYEQARHLYKYIADNLTNSNFAVRAKAWVAGCDIMLGDYAGPHEAIEALLTDSPADLKLPGQIYQLALVYDRVSRFEDAKRLYQHIVDNWPESDHAGDAQSSIAAYYERLRNSGSLPPSQANPKIEVAYRQVVERYPNSASVNHALLELGRLHFATGKWANAAYYLSLFLEKQHANQAECRLLYPLLGKAYENSGQLDKAQQVYRQFIGISDPTDPRGKAVKMWLKRLGGETI